MPEFILRDIYTKILFPDFFFGGGANAARFLRL